MDYSKKLGMFTFWSSQGKIFCKEEVIELGVISKEVLTERVKGLGAPNGGTPIAAAIREAIGILKEYRALDKRIILLTDGEETDGGDYLSEAKAAQEDGIKCEIHIIGLQLSESAKQKAEEIARVSKGSYSNVITSNPGGFSGSLSGFKAAINFSREKPVVQKDAVAYPGRSNMPPVNELKQSMQNVNSSNLALAVKEVDQEPEKYDEAPMNAAANPIEDLVENEEATMATTEDQNSDDMSKKKSKQAIEKLEQRIEALEQTINANNLVNERMAIALENLASKLLDQNLIDEDLEGEVVIFEDREHNTKVGRRAEEIVYEELKAIYGDRLKWNNQDIESNLDHDFAVTYGEVIDTYIECKGTHTDEAVFFLTRSEWERFINCQYNYQVFFVKNVLSTPEVIRILNLMDWITKGKIVPYAKRNRKVKAERVMLTILE